MFYFKRTLGLIVGTGLVCVTGTPAYGIDFQPWRQVEVQEVKTDSLKPLVQEINISAKSDDIVAERDSFVVMTHEELVAELSSPNSSISPASLPSNLGLLGAAMAQLGAYGDCTMLVENSLRALGYSVPDLGPMGFASYGAQVSPSEAQPGDIMMRGGHVAIYAGGGMAVQGGFNGSVVYTSQQADPNSYSIIVRVG